MLTINNGDGAIMISLDDVVETSNLVITTVFADLSASAYTPGTDSQECSGSGTQQLLNEPAGGTYRRVKVIQIFNADTAASVVTLYWDSDDKTIIKTTLESGSTLLYEQRRGWQIIPGVAVPTATPAHLWTFDEDTGTTAADTGSMADMDITLDAEADWSNDTPDGSTSSLDLTATGASYSCVEAGETITECFADGGTIAAWIKVSALDGLGIVFGTDMANPGIWLEIQDVSGDFKFVFGQANISQVVDATVLTPDTWHHIAATYGDGTCKQYVDGVLTTTTNSLTWTFTGEHEYGGSGIEGFIDDMRIYSRVLTGAEIAAIFAG